MRAADFKCIKSNYEQILSLNRYDYSTSVYLIIPVIYNFFMYYSRVQVANDFKFN